jgi:hypothetical protein
LNADTVTKIIWDNAKPTNFLEEFQSTRIFRAKLALSATKAIDVAFQLTLSKTGNGKQQLDVKLLSAG